MNQPGSLVGKKGAVTGIRPERGVFVYFCGLDISFVLRQDNAVISSLPQDDLA